MRVFGQIVSGVSLALIFLLAPSLASAQAAAQRGKLTLTVADPTGGVIPGAMVSPVGLEAATKDTSATPVATTDKGVVVFDNLVVGRYSARADFPGFEMGLLRDFKVNRGDNKHIVVLPPNSLKVTVQMDGQAAGADRGSSVRPEVTDEQIGRSQTIRGDGAADFGLAGPESSVDASGSSFEARSSRST